jgi:hypothetical protein
VGLVGAKGFDPLQNVAWATFVKFYYRNPGREVGFLRPITGDAVGSGGERACVNDEKPEDNKSPR